MRIPLFKVIWNAYRAARMFRFWSRSINGQSTFRNLTFVTVLAFGCILYFESAVYAGPIPGPIHRSVRLFSNGKQVENYNALMADLIKEKGALPQPIYLLFDDKEPILVKEFLGRGGLTAVFRRQDGRALRVPLGKGDVFFPNGPQGELKNNGPYTDGMLRYYTSMTKLASAGAAVTKIYEADTHLPAYITVEYFENRMNINDFFNRRELGIEKGRIRANQVENLKSELEVFVRNFARFSEIGDFKTDQIVTDGKTWRLVDSSEPVFRATSFFERSPFDHRFLAPRLSSSVNLWISMTVAEEREANHKIISANRHIPEPALRCELVLLFL